MKVGFKGPVMVLCSGLMNSLIIMLYSNSLYVLASRNSLHTSYCTLAADLCSEAWRETM